MKKLMLVVVLLGACTNPDLKAEKTAWERYAQRGLAHAKRLQACKERFGLNKIRADREAAAAKCKPFEDAHIKADVTRDYEAWSAAFDESQAAPSCVEERRLNELWIERYQELSTAKDCGDDAELAILKSEVLAACQRCATKERCEDNLKRNERAYSIKHFEPATAEDHNRLEEEKAKALENGGSLELRFACDK